MTPVWTSRSWLRRAALLWVGCAAVYFLTAPGRIDMYDGAIRYEVTTAMIEMGDTAVRHPWFFAVQSVDGWRYAFYQLGTPLTSLPFVLFGRWVGDGSREAMQFAFSMTMVPFAAGLVALLFLIYGRLGCSAPRALAWSLVAGFCTLLWPYAGSTFDVILQAFWLTIAVWSAIEAFEAGSHRWAALSAVAFAMLINVQETYVVLAAAVFASVPLTFETVAKRVRSPLVWIISLGVIAGVAGVLAYNAARFGNPLDTGRTAVPHPLVGNPLLGLAGLAVSPAKSVFLYTPPLVLALVGLLRLVRQAPIRFAPLVACLGIHLMLTATLKFWAGEWAWGPRYMVASLPLALVGLPFAWEGQRRAWAVTLCALGLVVQLLGLAVDHQRYYFERALGPYFWVDERTMYTDSPLFARPGEIAAVIDGRDLGTARAFVPGPLPLSMTSAIFGPPPELVPYSGAWMRRYLAFLVPRPWPLWSSHLPERYRPGPTTTMTAAAVLIAVVSFGALAALTLSTRRRRD